MSLNKPLPFKSMIVTGNPFKAIVQTLVVFLLLLGISVYALLHSITDALEEELASQIAEESRQLDHIYRNEGLDGLKRALAQVRSSEHLSDVYNNGESIIHSGKPPPSKYQWHTVTRYREYLQIHEYQGQSYAVKVSQLDEFVLVVGRSTHIIDTVRNRLLLGALLMGLAFISLALMIGYYFSRQSSQKLTQFETTLTRIADGDLTARLVVPDTGHQTDQIDQIAYSMNTQLVRLESLVNGMNHTIKAIAHDLKTPLSRAQISLYNALDSCERGDSPEVFIQQALDENVNLNRIFDTILRISRLQTQGHDKAFRPFVLHDMLEDVVEFLLPSAEVNDQTLSVACPPALSLVADRDMLQQAILNLVENAILYAGNGANIVIKASLESPKVKPLTGLSTELKSKQGAEQKVILQVIDDGVGVPDGELDNIATAFVRLDTSRSSVGNGLGLALVQAIADYHSASLTFSHNEPSGLCVSLVLTQ